MFNRPPRIQIAIKEYQVNLIPPPPTSSKPKINWATIGLPILAMGVVITLMFFFSGSISFLFFLPLMIASPLASIISYQSQKKEYESGQVVSVKAFADEIKTKINLIDTYKVEQTTILNNNTPSPADCLEIVSHQEIRVGERRPQDADFLSFRLGLGIAKSKINVTGIPPENRDPVYNNLYEEADKLVNKSLELNNTAILCDLKEIGSLGVVGKVEDLRHFGWSLALQLLTHHWPAEVNLASFTSYVEVNNWRWLSNVQHRAKVFPNTVIELKENEGVKKSLILLEEELRRRKSVLINMRAISSEKKYDVTLPALVIIFDRVSGIYKHAAFSLILKEGLDLGVYGIFLMDSIEELPSECGAYAVIESGTISYKVTGTGHESVDNIQPDHVTLELLQAFSNRLANIKWLIPEQVTEPPESLSLLELFPLTELDDLPLESWWGGKYPFGYLRAPIGKFSPTAELVFDLNDSDTGHGPHGLIGGMTGSGKSELLKTLILSLSITHHPYDLNFALIDYKGGGAFSEFHSLPHVVGVITDIQNHADYATRVVQSLSWEVKSREKILGDALGEFGFTTAHVEEYRTRLKVKIPIPRLVIIFDEFAEFQERHPDESKKLINIARVGRSLGIHLILCTQNPMGKAVDQQVRDNSNFTICLKVKTPDTSKSLINIPDAIQLRRGYAYFHVDGPQKFKVAYTGNDYTLSHEKEIDARKSNTGIHRNYLSQVVSEAQAIIEEISSQAAQLSIPVLPKIWPDPLPEKLASVSLYKKLGLETSWNGQSWTRENYQSPKIPLGLLDDPLHQKQPVFSVSDHLLIFGSSGSGKSTALLTFAEGISKQYSPSEAFIYCIDISGQSPLNILEKSGMPHLPMEGGVILGSDIERMNRLFKMIAEEMTRRKTKYNDLRTFNTQQINLKLKTDPYIFILIDGINKQFNSNNFGFTDQLGFVMNHGLALGIYVILTGNLIGDIPVDLQVQKTTILLQSTERGIISTLVKYPPETYQKKIDAGQEPKPGRGLINTNPALELQCAFPVDFENEENQDDENQFLRSMIGEIEAMSSSWIGNRPPSVENLSPFISISQLASNNLSEKIIIGKGQESLEPVDLSLSEDGPLFMITSMTSGLGKTSAIYLWITQLTQKHNPKDLKLVLIDYHTRTLRRFSKSAYLVNQDEVHTHVTKKEDLKGVIHWLKREVDERRGRLAKAYSDSPENFDDIEMVKNLGYILVVIDDYASFINSKPVDLQILTSAIVDGEEVGVRLLLAEDYALLGTDELLKLTKKYGCGLLLGGSEGLYAFNDAKPPHNQKTANLPPGRGYLVKRGQAQLIQAAAYWEKGQA